MKRHLGSLLVSALLVAGTTATADDLPTIKQVYEAAHAGRLDDAQKMMARVLAAQPNSAKAHFVEAELLAEQQRYAQAKIEFETAERLEPQLSFAKPEAVQKLTAVLGMNHASAIETAHAAPEAGFPWMTLLIVAGVIGIVAMIIGALRRRSQVPVYSSGAMAPHGGPGVAPMAPHPMPGMVPGMAPAGGGLGSSVMTGLATGAAVGVGIVAGEALAHHFIDGDRASNVAHASPPPIETASAQPYDMGGNDFGVVDDSQWGSNDVGSISDSSSGDWS
jgi:uncharacterized protein